MCFHFLRPVRAILVLSASLLGLSGCGQSNGAPEKVVTTTGMIADLARNVGGGLVQVEEIMGPGVDPHLYQPKASDRRKLDEASLVLFNGLHLEGNMAEMLEHLPRSKAVSADIPKDRLLIDAGQPDPHVWFDVSLWIIALGTVEKAMVEAFPAHADAFHKNAVAYRKQLEALHAEVQRDLATIPREQRVLVTAHDAFRYFGRAYDVEVVGLQGVSTADEAGLREVQRVVDRVVQAKVKAIFTETSVPPDGIEKVVERCKANGHSVRIPSGKLFSDAMDRPGTPGGTYPGMVRHNVKLMVEALK
jgi:manganese/zinc/iron transport system substrate-binding protein